VMGANILNMGLITVAIGYGLYRSVSSGNRTLRLVVAGIAAWLSVMAGALFTSLQLWLSGTSQLQIVIPAMLTVHALIGLGEALITVAALGFILQTRPDLLGSTSESAKGSRGWVFAGALISLAVVLLSPLASANPDGLERVAGTLGFLSKGASAPFQLIPNYTLSFLGNTPLSTILAGLIGLAVVGAIIVLLGQGMRAKS
jgi:cobalt/nickel transport system permease protein